MRPCLAAVNSRTVWPGGQAAYQVPTQLQDWKNEPSACVSSVRHRELSAAASGAGPNVYWILAASARPVLSRRWDSIRNYGVIDRRTPTRKDLAMLYKADRRVKWPG